MKPQRLGKADFLSYWSSIASDMPVKMTSVPYKHKGSTFDCDGIRLTGSKEFIESVLSRLKDLLRAENNKTRLQVNYQQSVDRNTQQPIDGWNCYIQVHERGREAQMVNVLFNVHK